MDQETDPVTANAPNAPVPLVGKPPRAAIYRHFAAGGSAVVTSWWPTTGEPVARANAFNQAVPCSSFVTECPDGELICAIAFDRSGLPTPWPVEASDATR